jgi:outer membrane receptor protein involved in Fe transport
MISGRSSVPGTTDGATALLTAARIFSVLWAVSLAAPAHAQGIEEIVVTAQKREQQLQDVPSAISAFSGENLDAMGAESFIDYARSIPGLTFQEAGAGRQAPTIRGINPTAGAPAVSYYLGETPMPANFFFLVDPRLVDIARIEVLRGPQGTLYGSSSIGGTIRLIPNAPDLDEVSGSVKATGMLTEGADGLSPGGDAELVLNVPIVEGVAGLRGAIWGSEIGGFIDRTFPGGKSGNIGDESTWGLRMTGLFQPNEKLDITAMAYVQHQHFNGVGDITGGAGNPDDDLVQNFLADTSEPQDNDFEVYNATIEYRFDALPIDFLSSTSYSEQDFRYTMEGMSAVELLPTFFGLPAVPRDQLFPTFAEVDLLTEAFTQEARLATSEPVHGFDAIVGVYYSRVDQESQFHWSPPEYNEVVAGNDPTNIMYAPGNNLLTAFGPGEKVREFSQFGELTYHVTDALSITGGFRHYHVTRSEDLRTNGWFIGFNTPGVEDRALTDSESDGFVYKGNISYQLTDDHLLYGQYSEGFRRGFGNRPLPTICAGFENLEQVDPDSIKNYELGAKTNWLDGRLNVNAAGYRIDWTDIQQMEFLDCGFSLVTNFGEARIHGAELEVSSALTDRIDVGFSGTYMRAKLLQDLPALGALEGDQIQHVPHWQYAMFLETTLPVFESDDGFARIDYQYTGHSYSNFDHLPTGERDPVAEVESLHLLNMRVGLRYDNWEFSFLAQNLLDDVGHQALDPNSSITLIIPGRPRYVVNRPRTFSLSVGYQF